MLFHRSTFSLWSFCLSLHEKNFLSNTARARSEHNSIFFKAREHACNFINRFNLDDRQMFAVFGETPLISRGAA